MFPKSHVFGDISLIRVVSDPPFFENGYILHDRSQNQTIAIDPGAPAARFGVEFDKLNAKFQAIWLTHAHPDHISGAARLMADYDVACWVHRDEKMIVEMAPELACALTLESFEPPAECTYFADGDAPVFGDNQLRILHVPGHSPGSVVFAFDDFALTGDTLFNQGIGRADLAGGDARELVSSIDRLLGELSAQTVLFSGHGPPWTVAEARPWWDWLKTRSGLI